MRLIPTLVLALAAALPLAATPTRVSTLDNGHLLVPDDWDGAMNYALAGSFKDRAYFDVNAGQAMAWAFFDIHAGTLVLWWNNPYEGAGLYQGLGPASFNFQAGALPGSAGDPGDRFIRVPENRVALGWAFDLSEALSAALCVRWARGDERGSYSYSDAAGGAALSSAEYMGSGGYASLSYTSASNSQFSEGLILSPQFAFKAQSWSLDGKGEYSLNQVASEHRESLTGPANGELQQALRDQGLASYGGQLRLRCEAGEKSSLVLRGRWERFQQGLEHRLKGSFSGGGLSASELAGYDHRDQSVELLQDSWEGWFGFQRNAKNGLLILALGAQGDSSRSRARHWYPVDTSVSYDELYLDRQQERDESSLRVPVLLGVEVAAARWVRARAMVQRDLWRQVDARLDQDRLGTTGAVVQHARVELNDSTGAGWAYGMGLSLELGDLVWDLALQSEWLGAASGTALTQPLLRSTWAFAF